MPFETIKNKLNLAHYVEQKRKYVCSNIHSCLSLRILSNLPSGKTAVPSYPNRWGWDKYWWKKYEKCCMKFPRRCLKKENLSPSSSLLPWIWILALQQSIIVDRNVTRLEVRSNRTERQKDLCTHDVIHTHYPFWKSTLGFC